MIARILLVVPLLLTQVTFAQPYILVLGVAQDGGYPHMGCDKKCCRMAWAGARTRQNVVSLAIVDPGEKKWWLVEATPDIKEQLHYFRQLTKRHFDFLPAGIFITHAHIGHYAGLMQLGREVMNTKNIPVYVLPRMKKYLEENGPWEQLVSLHNIKLYDMAADGNLDISKDISVEAFKVPHRDEYSETAGFRIRAGERKYLFIPDVNKWESWRKDIVKEVRLVDVAWLDATFYSAAELGKIDIKEVPHPFVTETMRLFDGTNAVMRAKIHFIHFNHTNPLTWDVKTRQDVLKKGYRLARQGEML